MPAIPFRLAGTIPYAFFSYAWNPLHWYPVPPLLSEPLSTRFFIDYPNTLTYGRKPDREKCACIFLDVTLIRLNRKGVHPQSPVYRGFPGSCCFGKIRLWMFFFGIPRIFSTVPRFSPWHLGFFPDGLDFFPIALISFRMMLKTFHFRPWFLSAVDNSCFFSGLGAFFVDNYVDKVLITRVSEQQPALGEDPGTLLPRLCQTCRL